MEYEHQQTAVMAPLQTLKLEESPEGVVTEDVECETSEPSFEHAQRIQLSTSLNHSQISPTLPGTPGGGDSSVMQVCAQLSEST